MEDERIKKNFELLLGKLREPGDLPGLELEPDPPTEKIVRGKAVRLMRRSEQLAMALIGPARAISPSDEVMLVGDEAAKGLASRLGLEFISAKGLAGLLARLVLTGLTPPAE